MVKLIAELTIGLVAMLVIWSFYRLEVCGCLIYNDG